MVFEKLNYLFIILEVIINIINMCDFGGTTRKLCIKEDCKVCFEASFASSKRVDAWSKKNDKIARQVFKGADTKYFII